VTIFKKLDYLGVETLDTPAKIKVEIAGLNHAISQAKEMICRLEQSLALLELSLETSMSEET
jgi:hypothetical protein